MDHIITDHIKIYHSAQIVRHHAPKGRKKPPGHPSPRTLPAQLSCNPGRSHKADQKTKGRTDQIRRPSACCKYGNPRQSHCQVNAHTGSSPSGPQHIACQKHKKELQRKMHGKWLNRNIDPHIGSCCDQSRKQAGKCHFLAFYPLASL